MMTQNYATRADLYADLDGTGWATPDQLVFVESDDGAIGWRFDQEIAIGTIGEPQGEETAWDPLGGKTTWTPVDMADAPAGARRCFRAVREGYVVDLAELEDGAALRVRSVPSAAST